MTEPSDEVLEELSRRAVNRVGVTTGDHWKPSAAVIAIAREAWKAATIADAKVVQRHA